MKPDIPAELKSISPYIQRSNETANHDPVISYYCRYRAVQLAIAVQNRSPEANTYLSKLLDDLEALKAKLSDQDSLKDDVVGRAYVENFALSIFNRADREEREGGANKNTPQTFMAAATFLDVVRVFGDLDSEIAEKIKYAKYHAARILKDVKAGRDPNEEQRAVNTTTTSNESLNDQPGSSVSLPAETRIPEKRAEDVFDTERQRQIESAQKHARWAISALNYEDISTAITELQKALSELNE